MNYGYCRFDVLAQSWFCSCSANIVKQLLIFLGLSHRQSNKSTSLCQSICRLAGDSEVLLCTAIAWQTLTAIGRGILLNGDISYN